MSMGDYHQASSREIDRLARTLLGTNTFGDADELAVAHRDEPWRVQVSSGGDIAVLGRWRDHLSILEIQALWCPLNRIAPAVAHFLDLGSSLGYTDVVSPPTPVEEARVYESAGMHTCATVATFLLDDPGEVAERPLPAELTLRAAGHRDIPTILGVDESCFDPFWRYDARHLARFCSTGHLTIAERDGEAVGYTLCTIDGGFGLLGRLGVIPGQRRRGVGSALLLDAVRRVREHGGVRLSLSTQIDNMSSQRLYRKMHFRDTGRRYVFLRFGSDE